MYNIAKYQYLYLLKIHERSERMKNDLDIDIRKLTLPNGRTLEKQMKYEAKRFLKILQEEIDRWYRLYSPKIYQRTYDMRNSIYAEDLVQVSNSGDNLQIKINYDDTAFHKSLWDASNINSILLMNNGYQVSKGWHKDIENFGYREGGHFLERAVYRFNKENDFGIDIIINY